MKESQIDVVKQALLQMDVGNDAHWTSKGEPKLDTVKILSSGVDVTREDLQQIAPGFSRTNFIIATVEVEPPVQPTTPVTPTVEPTKLPENPTPESTNESLSDDYSDYYVQPELTSNFVDSTHLFLLAVKERNKKFALLDAEVLEDCVKHASNILQLLNDSKNAITAAILEEQRILDIAKNNLNGLKPQPSLHSTIQGYLESQKNLVHGKSGYAVDLPRPRRSR